MGKIKEILNMNVGDVVSASIDYVKKAPRKIAAYAVIATLGFNAGCSNIDIRAGAPEHEVRLRNNYRNLEPADGITLMTIIPGGSKCDEKDKDRQPYK